ncbi:hypothetical protein BJF88_02045 [Cellulosimicrobium sp. CUA-896]|nr:hypothetical protein BJF88_02045 [Cellulosimicrobium sp. CUA-896]
MFALGGAAALGGTDAAYAGQVLGLLLNALVTYLGAALVGEYVATRRSLLAELRDRVRQAEREREVLAAQAVLEERGRMARELHDVAAHHLSGIVVQAAAAERLVEADPERAKESLRRIRAQGRETLDNMRLVVGLLRAPAPPRTSRSPRSRTCRHSSTTRGPRARSCTTRRAASRGTCRRRPSSPSSACCRRPCRTPAATGRDEPSRCCASTARHGST